MPRHQAPRFVQGLNAAQAQAVLATEGPVLVLAGAGTGKTRVITHRIAHLLERGVAPENVLAVTFTNKAAGEMRERAAKLVGKAHRQLLVATFHRFSLLALREHGARVGLAKSFAICDEADQLAHCKAALRELAIPEASLSPAALRARISLAKNRLQTPEALLAAGGDGRDELAARGFARYAERLVSAQTVDFDDLLLLTQRLFAEHADVRAAFEERHRYVLVDEYQDTNAAQYEILRSIAGRHRNLCVVGDDDQSIYGWRGADVQKILGFERDFPGAKVVRLETNYRSTAEILDAAYRCIQHNRGRHEKRLVAHNGHGDRVRAYNLRDENDEARFVVDEIQTLVREGAARLADFAVLFRTANQPRAFEAELRVRNVPYRLVGGMSFFDRKEVRDVLAYLRLCLNQDDESAFLRVLNAPPRGIGRTAVEKATAYATAERISVPAAFGREDAPLPAAAHAAGRAFRALLATLAALDFRRELVRSLERVIEAVGYRGEVERAYADERERQERWAGVQEVLNFAQNHAQRATGDAAGLAGFLGELALSASDERDETEETGERVTLMTLHAAKGLEFPRVYLAGVEEGLLPHARAALEDTVEEERRLMYVGITRAQRVLTLTYAATRAKFGRPAPCHASRFLFEMQGKPPPPGWVAAGEVAPQPAPKGKGKARAKAKRGARAKRR
jgi:DNA helicase-2/ATP-dependent DNA helicase PcrA